MTRTIFITGSTDGIGKLAAIKLAKDGHQVLVHGRSEEKVRTVTAEIKALAGNNNLTGFVADLSEFNSVIQLVKNVKEYTDTIDVLINNAGVYNSKARVNSNGLDMRYMVNHFAPCLLTEELLPQLRKGTDSRLINLSSAAQAPVVYNVLRGEEKQSAGATYAQSKLAILMWSFWMAENHKDIAVTALNPGSLLNTKMVKEAFGNHWSSADKGADIIYELAVSDDFSGVTGKYFDNDRGTFGMAHSDAYNDAEINKLIDETEKIITKYKQEQ